ncbi:MAG: Holliday junction resolvase RuvX [bacterium]|nr:Holliday junction resolvase RuvX [bacterium]
MIILGIDYGKSKIGLAIAEGPLAAPLGVLRVKSLGEAVEKVLQTAQTQHADKVVVGISENQVADEQRGFVRKLRECGLEVEEWDETLSTHDAQSMAIAAGRSPKKRREMEDAFAATIVLQSYLDAS